MAKKKVVYVCLGLFTLWPIVHIAMTRVYDLNPWKLAGWGMYSKPRLPNPGIELEGRRAPDAPYKGVGMDATIQAKAAEFLGRSFWLGDLVEPSEMAQAVLTRYPQLRDVRITLSRYEMRTDSGMVEEVERQYEYHR